MRPILFVLLALALTSSVAFSHGKISLVKSSFRPSASEKTLTASRGNSLDMMFGSMGKSSSKINVPKGKKLCVVTGTSSGLGKETARSLIESGEYFVVCACRDVNKMENVASSLNFDKSAYKVMELDLGSYESTKKFVKTLKASKSRGLDALVCNAAVYQPALDKVGVSL